MRIVFTFMLAALVLLMAAPVMAIACAGCDLALAPLAAQAEGFAAVHVSPGASELIAARAAQCEGTVKPFYIDMATITDGGEGLIRLTSAQGSPTMHTMIEAGAGITATYHARDRPGLSGGNATIKPIT